MWPRWSDQGDELFYIEGEESFYVVRDAMMAVSVQTESEFEVVGVPDRLFTGEEVMLGNRVGGLSGWPYDVTEDGQHFVMVQIEGQDKVTIPMITVVENWVKEFE